jgi:hypothetical protein
VERLQRRRARDFLYGLGLQLDISRGLYHREAEMVRTRIVLRSWERRWGKEISRNRCTTLDRSIGGKEPRFHAREPLNGLDLQLGKSVVLHRTVAEV